MPLRVLFSVALLTFGAGLLGNSASASVSDSRPGVANPTLTPAGELRPALRPPRKPKKPRKPRRPPVP